MVSPLHTDDGIVILFVGPSGAGKDTLSEKLMGKDPRVKFMVTATTRDPRPNEVDGVNYYFLTKEDFEKKLDQDDFLEWNRYHGNYYGALKEEVHKKLQAGLDPHTDITWSGARAMRDYLKERVVTFLILPPSLEELDNRMTKRRQSTGEDSENHKIRTQKIREDMMHWHKKDYVFTNEDMTGSQLIDYDYVIINDDLDTALYDIQCAIHAERLKRRV